MGFFGRLFGSEKAIEKGVDAVTSGIDKLFYTDEEKADNAMEVKRRAGEMLIQWMSATQGQNIARRLLALLIASVWLLMYIASTLLNIAVIWANNASSVANIQASARVIGERAMEMNGAMMLILGFYFAAPHMGDIIKTAMKKFSGDKTQ